MIFKASLAVTENIMDKMLHLKIAQISMIIIAIMKKIITSQNPHLKNLKSIINGKTANNLLSLHISYASLVFLSFHVSIISKPDQLKATTNSKK